MDNFDFKSSANRVKYFLENVVFADGQPTDEDYTKGTRKIEYYKDELQFLDYTDLGYSDYEDLIKSVFQMNKQKSNIYLVVGGIGGGKTATAKHIMDLFTNSTENNDSPTDHIMCECSMPSCYKQPLYICCNNFDEETSLSESKKKIYKSINQKLQEMILNNWWCSCHKDTKDVKELTSQEITKLKLAITFSDLFWWFNTQSDLNVPDVLLGIDRIDEIICDISPSSDNIANIISTLNVYFNNWTLKLSGLNSDDLGTLASALASYSARNCLSSNGRNVIIIDNLDPLRTKTIEKLVQDISRKFRQCRQFKIIIPIRPSAIDIDDRFTGIVNCVAHYSPNCFDMLFKRLKSNLFNKNRDQLLYDIHQTCGTKSDVKEYNHLMATCVVFSRILKQGMSKPLVDEYNSGNWIHEENKKFLRIEIPEDMEKELALCFDSHVGTSARYALRNAVSFIERLYTSNEQLKAAVDQILTNDESYFKLTRYVELVKPLMFDYKNALSSHTVEVFKPVEIGKNYTVPSLTKLYLLKYLLPGRSNVYDLIKYLGFHGIPSDLTIRSLNNVRDPWQRLIWLSKNSEIKSLEEAISIDACISEHGRLYVQQLINTFEYLWGSKVSLFPDRRAERLNFNKRLDLYCEIMGEMLETERKQILYWKNSTGIVPAPDHRIQGNVMHTLEILYKSVAKLAPTAKRVVNKYMFTETSENKRKYYRDEITDNVNRVCNLINEAEDTYFWTYGVRDNLYIYREIRTTAIDALEEYNNYLKKNYDFETIQEIDKLTKNNKKLKSLVAEKQFRPEDFYRNFKQIEDTMKYSVKDIVFLGSGLFCDIFNKKLDTIKEVPDIKNDIKRLTTFENEIQNLLKSPAPNNSSLRFNLKRCSDLCGQITAKINDSKGIQIEPIRNQLNLNKDIFEKIRHDIEENSYDCKGSNYQYAEIDQKKNKFNNYMRALRNLAELYMLDQVDHFNVEWS